MLVLMYIEDVCVGYMQVMRSLRSLEKPQLDLKFFEDVSFERLLHF